MEISNKVPSIHRTPGVQAPQGKVKGDASIQAPPKGDRVEISARAKEMQAAHHAIQQMPDVDMAKVAKIKAQIKEGRYKVDAQEIASKMMMESLLSDSEK